MPARLNDSIPEIEFTSIPLIQFLQFITDFGTIPVTLDPDVLPWLGITPATPVSMKQRDTNVSKLLTDVLTKIGLTYHVVDQQLFVTRRPANEDSKKKANLNVADLVGSDAESISRLRDHILELFAPESWDGMRPDAGTLKMDGTTMIVEQSHDVLFQVIAFCEKLRVARGLPIRGKFNAKNFEIMTRTQRAQPQLAKPVTLNYSRPSSFVKILQRLSEESGMQLLVDWRSVSEAGWNPDAEVTFTVVDQPLAKALNTLLQPMELDYRIVDESTIQIVIPQTLDERYELEIYPVGKIFGNTASEEDVLTQSLDLIPSDWLRQGGGRGAMRYDAPSQALLVSLTQRQQQQFAERLTQLEKKD